MLHDDLHFGARAIVGTFIVTLVFLAGFLGCNSEQKSWEEAVASNTPPAYETFLAEYSTGPLAGSARSHLGVLAWEEAERLNTRAAYKSFSEKYPQDPRSLDAARQL